MHHSIAHLSNAHIARIFGYALSYLSVVMQSEMIPFHPYTLSAFLVACDFADWPL